MIELFIHAVYIKAVFFICFVFGALLVSFYINKKIIKEFDVNLKTNLILPCVAAMLLFMRYGLEITIFKGFIFCMLLLFASISDYKLREVPDVITVMILITAFIGISLATFINMLITFIVISIILVLIIIFTKGQKIGGADIKIIIASSFLLGFSNAIIAIIIMCLAMIVFALYDKLKNKTDLSSKTYPFVPFIAIGCFISYLI